ncbi:MAG: hypothetical protein ACE5JX_01545 [Acidobacteriota bacterium]
MRPHDPSLKGPNTGHARPFSLPGPQASSTRRRIRLRGTPGAWLQTLIGRGWGRTPPPGLPRWDERVLYAVEPEGVEVVWRRYTLRRTYSPKIWNDAYLASFAAVGQFRLVTFDRAFSQFNQTRSLILG